MPRSRSELMKQIYAAPVLIVDDNEINRIFIEKTLSSRGFSRLLCVESSEAALECLESFKPDLVILDVIMPGIDGFECCETIRHITGNEDLPIIIQTSITVPELRYKAFVKGATDFVSKPIFPDELSARVIVQLERRLYLKSLLFYKKRIEKELESARHLQHSILPNKYDVESIRAHCNLDVASYFQPSSEIGGDFWGIKNLFPNQIAIWLVDFSGHGVAAALNAFRLQAYLKEHSDLAARPGSYLAHLNDKLLHLLIRGQFATMFYGIIDTKSCELHYATACAPHPIIYRGNTQEIDIIDGSGSPLGFALNMYKTHTIPFGPGDTLLLYSDALTERTGKDGGQSSEGEIVKPLLENSSKSSDHILESLLNHFHLPTEDAIEDDLTVVVCKNTSQTNV